MTPSHAGRGGPQGPGMAQGRLAEGQETGESSRTSEPRLPAFSHPFLGLVSLALFFEAEVFSFLKRYLFIYLTASGTSCGMPDPRCGVQALLLWPRLKSSGSIVVARVLSCLAVCGISVP